MQSSYLNTTYSVLYTSKLLTPVFIIHNCIEEQILQLTAFQRITDIAYFIVAIEQKNLKFIHLRNKRILLNKQMTSIYINRK